MTTTGTATRVREEFPHAVRVIENTWIPMADGGRLAARLWLPEDAARERDPEPAPAILEYLPYRKRDFMRARDEPMHAWFAGHGYASVRVDVRGSGDSDGLLRDEYSQEEHDDALAILRWIAAQPWCTGAVGMMGISWGGFNSLQVAALRPPELKAIITLCSTDDRYADDAHYMGGCLLNENLQWGSLLLSYQSLPPDPEIVGERWRDMWRERLERVTPFPEHWLRHQRRDDYWRHGSVCEDYEAIECPVYAIGGWADGYSNAVPRLLAGLRAPCKGLVGPWAHTFPHDGVPGPSIGFLQEALRWWDQWLRGRDTGILDEPAYRVWMQESVLPEPTRPEWPGRWVAEERWPPPKARIDWRRFALDAGGRLAETGTGTGDAGSAGRGSGADPEVALAIASPQTTGSAGGEWCAFGAEGEMPGDQRPDDGRSLCFDSEPLPERLEVLGAPVTTLVFASDRPVALACVRLCEVAPDGTSTRVSYGLLNLTHRESHEHPEPLAPGQRTTARVVLNDCAHAFPAGSRLRVAVSTAYWPIAWPPPEPVTLTLFVEDVGGAGDAGGAGEGASAFELPVRPPRPEDAALRRFEPPERGPSIEVTRLRPVRFRRTVERDLASNEIVSTLVSDAAELGDGSAALARVEAIDLDVGHTLARRTRIGESDPLSATAELDQRTDLRRGDWSVRVDARTRLTAVSAGDGGDGPAFRFEAWLEAYENGEPFYRRRWDERIPRDLV